VNLDTSAAAKVPGVRAIVTGQDCSRRHGLFQKDQPALAIDCVRYAGEVVAAVIADDAYAAADAAAAVAVEYEPLPAAGTMEAALESGAPRVFDGWPDNVAGLSTAKVGDPDAAFARAHLVVEASLGLARIHGVPIETRGIVVTPEGPDGRLTLWT